jgi:hydrocephalus-inducing protein
VKGKEVGELTLVPQFIEQDFEYLCVSGLSKVPEPKWPDPDKEPLPEPVIHQIIKKPPNRAEKKEITMFSIWTPLPEQSKPEGEEGESQGDKDKEGLPPMTKDQTRWVLGPKESRKLFVKFFSSKTGNFSQNLKFEVVGSLKNFDLNLQAVCEFPTINKFYRNVFMTHKKTRPPTMPESLLSRAFVVSENVFDFGPLLIKKDPEQRQDPKVQAVNASVLQITNNGKYKVEAAFTLKSTLPPEEGGTNEKSPFIVEPESMELEVDETKHLTVYSFPEQPKMYKDEIVCLIKNNPNPTIFALQAQGGEPIVEVDSEVVAFDRLLLGKKLTKTLTLKNVSPIPANWRLTGVKELPKEFQVSCTSGTLRPC